MYEIIFLFVLAVIWIIFAVVQDLKTKEIANWLNFSIIAFALGFRFFYSLFNEDFNFFYQGLIGLAVFYLIGNFFYYGRIFAGGDAKLMISLGAVIPFFENFFDNLNFFILFLFLFLISGAIYGFIWSIYLSIKNFSNFKRDFYKNFIKNKNSFVIIMIFTFMFFVFGFFNSLFFVLAFFLFLSFIMYYYARTVDECCMIKKIKPDLLREGDWLYKNIKIGKKTIEANWDGLTKEQIRLIQKKKKHVLIRQGIPFSPVFLISFVILFYLWRINIWKILF